MNGGIINCDCGQQQYVETTNDIVNCIKCEKQHQVYPILAEIEIEGEENGE